MQISRPLNSLALSILLGAQISATAFAEVRVNGATTVTYGLMRPQKEKIEKLAGTQLAILPSSTSRGLADLVSGNADIAMLAEPLEHAAASLNKANPNAINPADYVGRHVGNAQVQIIVHPSNPVARLSRAQLAKIFSGEVRNWSEIGGPNLAILLVGEPTSAPHKLITDALEVKISPQMRAVQNTNQTAVIVAQAPGAISYLSTAHEVAERSKLRVVETEIKVPLQLYLAYRKNAPGEVIRVVEAATAVADK